MEIKYNLTEINEVAKMIVSILGERRIIFLYGDLGSGKTRLSGEVIRLMLGDPSLIVQSPTYGIVNVYKSISNTIAHLDLYRIKSPSELYEIGLQEILQQSFCIIEWPEIMQSGFSVDLRGVCQLTIGSTEVDDERVLTILNPRSRSC
ncbi:tRNA threonylcarbamoyl adenosine modification protein YjeE [Neorickettsia helminthoeca str. Oregon]|uniref:tRNA threonylcarbamoyladenosine biosynthesis protein TsaE n=1 Tax=Neorickettsia helminthoeca str. Oregon TaxID=1286528 RepID=X5GX33_9RICK|nr:tRNA (adenosine(37)-N6)-threonylcarbamoyltransferase complex ATPase subunit type 1 TsaE [Neorickettsia helminthoeca]AHX11597.1 tRNA threonylcarbamoyl adenosine modification protein YjeE [Neorickettsia helminthoeca str. Oregon]